MAFKAAIQIYNTVHVINVTKVSHTWDLNQLSLDLVVFYWALRWY